MMLEVAELKETSLLLKIVQLVFLPLLNVLIIFKIQTI